MTDILKALGKGNLEDYSKTLKENLNGKRDDAVEEIEYVTESLTHATHEEVQEPEFVTEGDELNPDAEYFYVDTDESLKDLNEARRVVKINAKGDRRVKKLCGKGFKLVGNKCVKQTGQEKTTMRKSKKKMAKTLKAKGSIVKLRTRRFKKALKKRKARGL